MVLLQEVPRYSKSTYPPQYEVLGGVQFRISPAADEFHELMSTSFSCPGLQESQPFLLKICSGL